MRILRTGEVRTGGQLLQCEIFVRQDFTVVSASEWYYKYVGINSYLPVTDLVDEEDAAVLKEAIADLTEPVEVYTRIANRREDGFRNIYLRLENCDLTEDGNRLYQITMQDVLDLEARRFYMERHIAKYRYFLTLKQDYYFEYTQKNNLLQVYKYVNERAIKVLDADLDDFVDEKIKDSEHTQESIDQLNTFRSHLKNNSRFFEMEFTEDPSGKFGTCSVKGGVCYKNLELLAGIFMPDRRDVKEVYYLTEAAKDAGTGLLNKKASTEYAIEKIQAASGKTMWFLVMDIDDFKNINDSFGHLFGDEVLREVANTLRNVVGQRGIVGRFGGDEFFVMLEKVESREDLKMLIKTVVKRLAAAFDPKCKLTASIGVSQYPVNSTNFEELFGMADKALYIAKEKGKNRHVIYEERLHGAYTEDSVNAQAVTYAMSREKRRDALIDIMSKLYLKGASYIIDQEDVQKNIRGLFDLDGLTIYSEYGNKVLCRNGNYVCEPEDIRYAFQDAAYMEMFGEKNVLAIPTMEKLKVINHPAYEVATRQEIGATVQCIAKKGGKPFAMIDFDILNQTRKWSDNDIELLGMIGCCLGRMLSGECD
ncbi:MAG: GGDEF domain-containing protein [Candidatus Gastranaerophilales bacterium]|nr:GGDEF domain-containing protein [Candidatus Gastranaerophilales bacterium]